MPIEIKVPTIGESITEGRISRWLKADGSAVKRDEPVCELETDKATAEVPAPAAGVLKHIAKEGDTVAIGAVIGSVDENAKATAAAPADPAPKVAAPAAAAKEPAAREAMLSPAAKRAAEEEKIDPNSISGSGRGGRVIKEDVYAAKAAPAASPAPTPATPPPVSARTGERETREKMTGIRQRIAQRLVESQQTTATLTTFNEVDMSAIMALREKFKDKFKEKHGVGLGFMSFFVKASIEALKAFPLANSRIDGGDIVKQHFYDIGVAVSTERGLMVPIVRDADRLSFANIEKKIVELAVKARDAKIGIGDLQGGTFTITNGGVFGSLLSTPILNPPQTAILGMHTIQKRPVAVNDQVVIRPMMYLALSYDHRLIDGREAVQFLVRIKDCVESPERMLLEI
ncbi:2-oxoglutarate dehydrogenase complex dihydrolipoyllysine-residue succinyltransferase [Zavarzinella formosa]|uniref:2-oxoglutarate dehydrogenase complex dihydrolipoyllysine-residue succinyltransferase n=1 Tax=Zavarzinella formosa TaxID=360055 RepID=UPI0002FCC1CD|nr:2-oxoglutarate dehydrogenase complex dihydrolipoyllysine-residue succinyltransferase [Zavarzinella formosa]